jgi:hypothetical protein
LCYHWREESSCLERPRWANECVRPTLACVRSPCVCVCRESRSVGAFFFFPTALFKLTHFYTYRSTVGNALLGQREKNFGGVLFSSLRL